MKRLHLISNAHIDPIWQWTEDEGISAVISTFRSAIRLLDEYDYIFCHNEALVYGYVEKHDPALFEEIKAAVAAGKWKIMGGWFLQPDCNMPSGESIVRQIAAGKRYFESRFGKWSTAAVNVDPFGHSRGLVQILKKSGQDGYLFMRPYGPWQGEGKQLDLPAETFLWEGLDGSTIRAARMTAYSSALGKAAEKIKGDVALQEGLEVGFSLWGVGNHGGGPSRKDLADIREYIAEQAQKGVCVKYSTPEEYLDDAAPTEKFDRSLRISMPGCYTSMSRVKQRHAQLETALYSTEKMWATIALSGLGEWPAARLEEAETDLLKAEFHDILPGSSVQSAENAALAMLDHGLHTLATLRSEGLFTLYRNFPYRGKEQYPIAVYNPHPYEWTTEAEFEFTLADQNWSEDEVSHVTVVDESGKEIAAQTVKEEGNINLDWRKRILFRAPLKPLGVTWFGAKVEFRAPDPVEKNAFAYRNGDIDVEIDPQTGLLKKFAYKGKQILADAFRPLLFEDNADSWAMAKEQAACGMGKNPKPFVCGEAEGVFSGLDKVTVTEDGPMLLAVEALFSAGDSKIVNEYRIYKHAPYMDVTVRALWREADRMLKLEVPCALAGDYVGQTMYGSEKLFMNGRECVAQRFVGIESGKDFFEIANDGVYGSSYREGRIYLSLLRGAGYCVHPIPDRPLLKERRFAPRLDSGEHVFRFRIGSCRREEAERFAEEFLQPPVAINIFTDPTPSDAALAPLSISDRNIVLKSFKQLADGRFVLRLFYNAEGEARAEVSLCGKKLALRFGKFEVKTLVYDGKNFSESAELLA